MKRPDRRRVRRRGGYPSGSKKITDLPPVPAGPAPGAKARPRLGNLSPSIEDLRQSLREHAYFHVAIEEMLTIEPTPHGARVPSHWKIRADLKIAECLDDDVLLAALANRGIEFEGTTSTEEGTDG